MVTTPVLLRGSRMPTFQGRPQRVPITRVSPPALTSACSTPARWEDGDTAVDRMALGDAAQIDAHPVAHINATVLSSLSTLT